MYEALPVSSAAKSGAAAADPPSVNAPSSLHACSRLKSGNAVCRYSVFALAAEKLLPLGIPARQVEEIHPSEYHQETTQQRDCVDGIRRIEASEEYE